MAYHVPPAPYLSPKTSQAESLPTTQSEASGPESSSEVQNTTTVSRNRRRSSAKTPGLKRAVSSPNVRNLAAGESVPLSPVDQKRNKLGYHRTTIACGHCRRRKIRCIPANEDPNGRCQNCIRLKKDCQFFPVDQQGPSLGRRARSGSKTEGNANEVEESVPSSSPRILASSTIDQIKNVNGQIGTPPLTDDGSGYQSFGGPGGTSGLSEFHPTHGYGYRPSYEVPAHPLSHYASSSPRVHSEQTHFDPSAGHYFSPQDHQGFHNPYSSPPLSGTMATSPHANTYQFQQTSPRGADFSWAPHPPGRSMSIADTEDLRHMYPQYRSNTYPTIAREGTATEVHHIPSGHPGLMQSDSRQSHFPRQFASPSSFHQMHVPSSMAWSTTIPGQMAPPVSGPESYSTDWYNRGSNLPYVREEEPTTGSGQTQGSSHQMFRPNPG